MSAWSAELGPLIAVVLGVVQGLTEFLPVSSSGHLALAEAFLEVPGGGVAFAVLLHAGTLLAIGIVFRDGVFRLVRGGLRLPLHLHRPPRGWPEEVQLAAKVVLATIPGAFVGLFLEDRIEAAFASPRVVGGLLWVTAALLFSTRRSGTGQRDISWRDAIMVGLAQSVAILPGISRSGSTIATALLLGVSRPKAAEFSFLAALPLILGSLVLELPELLETGREGGFAPLAIGFATSFLVGWAALLWLVKLVRRGALHWFAFYCIAAGAVAIFLAPAGG